MTLVWVLLIISGLIRAKNACHLYGTTSAISELILTAPTQIPFSVPRLVTELCHSQLLFSFCSYFFLLNFCERIKEIKNKIKTVIF
ncbi:hypothetical protein BY996DRAFT_7489614 [Phakopsora pachyrhizi]|uniref:Expressed protein n=1 Tax=Phakopsora pachyrhizi TaxID=170000 RepID=A0AAV0AX38_PHAPC|nr:hypothetical protein BY996DRAFT_7489614 [Phakopsora pachyrhizi]CAH7674847.1 expressed protein [Phakopsora pachyrhizi]